MNILITGGAGFIGQKLASKLILQGHDVTAIDTLSTQIHGMIPNIDLPNGLKLIRSDICNIDVLTRLVENADIIYHLAAETGTGQSMYKVAQYVQVNEMGTASLLEALAKC